MPKKNDPSFDLATLRKEILTYCEPLPSLIKTHGPASLGSVALTIGKCFKWIGPTVDQYSLVQPLPGCWLPTVFQLGEELRVIGLELIHSPSEGELTRQIETLERQIILLREMAANAELLLDARLIGLSKMSVLYCKNKRAAVISRRIELQHDDCFKTEKL
jgi:hypothetical protein